MRRPFSSVGHFQLVRLPTFIVNWPFIFKLARLSPDTKWPKNKKYNYGYARIELIIAFGNVAFIWVVTAALLFEAVKRVQDLKSFEVEGKPMVIMASLAIVFNLMWDSKKLPSDLNLTYFSIGLTLHGDGHSNHDINIRAAFVHVLGDLMQVYAVQIIALKACINYLALEFQYRL